MTGVDVVPAKVVQRGVVGAIMPLHKLRQNGSRSQCYLRYADVTPVTRPDSRRAHTCRRQQILEPESSKRDRQRRSLYGAKYPVMSSINCVVPCAQASVLPSVLGTMAMFEVTAPSTAFNVETLRRKLTLPALMPQEQLLALTMMQPVHVTDTYRLRTEPSPHLTSPAQALGSFTAPSRKEPTLVAWLLVMRSTSLA